jgi:hypothetical protein
MKLAPPPLRSAITESVGSVWFNALYTALTKARYGSTAQRPNNGLVVGQSYYDETLGQPIWWSGSGWVDADGGSV